MADPTPSTSTATLDPSIYARLHPRAYLARFLSSSYRTDGRQPSSSRGVQLQTGSISTADGSCLVKMGGTTVVCGVKAELCEPDMSAAFLAGTSWGRAEGSSSVDEADAKEDRRREGRGWIVPNLDLPAVCSPRYRPGPPGEEAQVLSERLYELLIENDVLDLHSLLIEPHKAAWVLYFDLVCMNHDGNAFDAAALAMLGALRTTRLPKARWDDLNKRVVCSRKERVSLNVRSLPIPLTFGVFDGQHLLTDPSAFEEPLLDSQLTITLPSAGKVSIHLSGSVTLQSPDGRTKDGIALVGECIQAAKKRRTEVINILEGS